MTSKEDNLFTPLIMDVLTIFTGLCMIGTARRRSYSSQQMDCFNNLLIGVLLWEKIDKLRDSYLTYILESLADDSLTKEFCRLFNDGNLPELSEFIPFKSELGIEEYEEGLMRDYFTDGDKNSLIQRINVYLCLSSKTQQSYLPHPIRADYLYANAIKDEHTRAALLDMLEERINKFESSKVSRFDTPILFDYIRKEAKSDLPREMLKCALELRYHDDVIALRQSIDNFEQFYGTGSLLNKKMCKEEINYITNKIFRKYGSLVTEATVSVGTTGVILNELPLPTPDYIKRKFKIVPRFDEKFIYKIVDFSIRKKMR